PVRRRAGIGEDRPGRTPASRTNALESRQRNVGSCPAGQIGRPAEPPMLRWPRLRGSNMRRRIKVISGLAVAGAAAGLGTLVAIKVRHNRAEVTFEDGHSAVATVDATGDVEVTCACGQPNCEH